MTDMPGSSMIPQQLELVTDTDRAQPEPWGAVRRWWGDPERGFPRTDEPEAIRAVVEADGAVTGTVLGMLVADAEQGACDWPLSARSTHHVLCGHVGIVAGSPSRTTQPACGLRDRDPPTKFSSGSGTLAKMTSATRSVRTATVADASVVANLLDRFNREYNTPTPGPAVLAARLEHLLSSANFVALLAGDPAVGLALLTLRPNVWCAGPVSLLDELYVVPVERGRGSGTALLKAAERECRQHGSDLLEINVDGEDAGARRFYERHGYVDHEPGQTEPQLYYHRDLVPPS